MHLVGKLLKQAALAIANQPWTDLVFPANCVSCRRELTDLSSAKRDDSPASQGGSSICYLESAGSMLADAAHDHAMHSDAVQDEIAPPAGSSLFSTAEFQQWQSTNWCDSCWGNVNQRSRCQCRKCGARLRRPSPFEGHCSTCLRAGLKFDRAIAIGNYEGLIRDLVIRMKNQHDEVLAIQLGKLLGYELVGHGCTDFDQVIPVPLHWSRRLKRGFQATEILTHQISRITGIRRCTRSVRIVRATAKQGTLSVTARATNVRNAFAVCSKRVAKGARVLLVDDVMTSGATASEIARVLKTAGASHVAVAVIARGGVQ